MGARSSRRKREEANPAVPSPIGQINILGDTGLFPSFQQQQVPFLFSRHAEPRYLNEITLGNIPSTDDSMGQERPLKLSVVTKHCNQKERVMVCKK